MQVKKQNVKAGKTIYEGDIKTSAEGSIIVPDVKADILRVLQVDADAYITEKQTENGRITVKGKVNVNVIYLPESGDSSVQCINGCFDFCEAVKKQEFEEGISLTAVCDTEKVGYKLINSRKIGIEAQVVIGIQVFAEKECSFVTEIDENAEVKRDNICFQNTIGCRDFSLVLEETADLPQGGDDVCEIIKTNIMLAEKEYKALTDKLVVKGRAYISVLYLTVGGQCGHLDFEVPFTEVFDFDGLAEDSECDITFSVCNTEFYVNKDMSGTGQCISMTANISVSVKCEYNEEFSYIADCYLTNAECKPIREEIESNTVLARPRFSAVLKEFLQKPDGAPDISSVYTAVAKPYINSTQVQNGRISVSGKAVAYVIYTTENPQLPICSINEEIPFAYMIDCENVEEDADIFLSVECEHISYAISSGNSVEIRCGLGINGRAVKRERVSVITELETSELADTESGITVYFVGEGDTVWDVAKRYHVCCEDIMRYNSVEDGAELITGEKLIIPGGK